MDVPAIPCLRCCHAPSPSATAARRATLGVARLPGPLPSRLLAPVGFSPVRDRWFSQRALLLHLALAIWVPGCLVAAWWQVNVALSGNSLGWAYSVEWPIFSVLGMVAWWQFLHDDPETVGARGLERARQLEQQSAQARPAGADPAEPAVTPAPGPANPGDWDEDLVAYNAYLASLDQRGTAKTWRNPTGVRQP